MGLEDVNVRRRMRQLTVSEPSDKLIKSSYGEISYGDWCELEVKRIEGHGGEAILKREGTNVCVMLTKFGKDFYVEKWLSCQR